MREAIVWPLSVQPAALECARLDAGGPGNCAKPMQGRAAAVVLDHRIPHRRAEHVTQLCLIFVPRLSLDEWVGSGMDSDGAFRPPAESLWRWEEGLGHVARRSRPGTYLLNNAGSDP